MKITTKKQAEIMLVESLFTPVNGRTLSVSSFDNGKYEWTGSVKDYVDIEVPNIDRVHAVYPERRQDKDGPYCKLMCVHEDR